MKPIIWRENGLWYCGRPGENDNVNYGVSPTLCGAWRKWFEFTRFKAIRISIETILYPPGNMLRCSALAHGCLGLIKHDRYLLNIDRADAQEEAKP